MLKVFLLFRLILVVFIGASIYVPLRLANLFQLKRKKILFVSFMAGVLSLPLSWFLQRFIDNGITGIYYLISITWMGWFFYIFLFLLGFEILNLFLKIKKKIAGTVVLSLAALVSIYAMGNANIFQVNHVDIPIKGLKSELKIVHISDLHLGPNRGKKYLQKIVKATNDQKPDIVLITGDLVDSNIALTESILSHLKSLEGPVYFTTGNHESYINLEKALKMISKNGVRILRNEMVKTNNIQLIGLDYMNADQNSFDIHSLSNKTLKEELPKLKISPNSPSILMHHSPVGIEYVNQQGINLMLTGHTHSGQIFPINFLSKLFFPYHSGLYYYQGTYVYVSQGAGTYGPRMRLGTKNEITVIKLKKVGL